MLKKLIPETCAVVLFETTAQVSGASVLEMHINLYEYGIAC